ncbi:hypothetical protein [Propionibacterium australiense]|uniref:Uncharacterized protein n=1 Tax=Propionibacterium australiense TaxID=119981 RepID=A0A383S7H7_9ACTN|nr:hypothetical protein [Propionibacterium australiense]RLP07693.1 hypothetical protein D7U36_10900 [Propionibacterium australiense]RLP08120.1 hypothetical protein D9T14_09540 [Propionibacterium australiense]SYZ33671.1 Hypothetical protein PROPAUS_1591 [Propionibacterium australiense]VEH92969.1 Uncharacterised protein [Propionibacterium australiense]
MSALDPPPSYQTRSQVSPDELNRMFSGLDAGEDILYTFEPTRSKRSRIWLLVISSVILVGALVAALITREILAWVIVVAAFAAVVRAIAYNSIQKAPVRVVINSRGVVHDMLKDGGWVNKFTYRWCDLDKVEVVAIKSGRTIKVCQLRPKRGVGKETVVSFPDYVIRDVQEREHVWFLMQQAHMRYYEWSKQFPAAN